MTVWREGARLVVGHRGGRGPSWPPENTIEAFERARREGAGAVELDVRTTADGAAVVMHDRSLARTVPSGDARRVAELSLGALRAVDLGGGVRIPSLRDALAWARDAAMGVNVELKYDVPNRVAVARDAIAAVRAIGADVLFSSFDPALVAMVAAGAPRWPRALLTHAEQPWWADAVQRLARRPWVDAMHLDRVQAAAAQRFGSLRRRGLRVGVWTVNEPSEAAALLEAGASWVITDRPGEIVAAR